MAVTVGTTGFRRYAVSLQYHGSSFLGFSSHGDREDCLHPDGTDLRGYRSVESRLGQALTDMVGANGWRGIQVSSRTDRGAHAFKNTCHVDIRVEYDTNNNHWPTDRLHRALNFHLGRQQPWFQRDGTSAADCNQERPKTSRTSRRNQVSKQHARLGDYWRRYDPMNEMRVLQVLPAPTDDWHARYSATQRTYLYRIWYSTRRDADYAAPFEWDRAWRVLANKNGGAALDVHAIRQAARHLVGEHDFSSFRGKGCQRSSPVTNLMDIQVHSCHQRDLSFCSGWTTYSGASSLLESNNRGSAEEDVSERDFVPGQSCQLVNLIFTGNAFLYRQVRNLTGCLVDVGRGDLNADTIPELLAGRNRRLAPAMAPPHGLYLVNVQHGDFRI
jgi:tRNA pseudouridine38-40 synthase